MDEKLRDLERRWHETGSFQDGDRWVEEVMRSRGTPTLSLISRVIRCERVIEIMFEFARENSSELASRIQRAFNAVVTPEDMIDFVNQRDTPPIGPPPGPSDPPRIPPRRVG